MVRDAELTAQCSAVTSRWRTHYFLKARTSKGRLIDSVARFPNRQRCAVEKIAGSATSSRRACARSAGVMVNYLTGSRIIEKNQEAYANQGDIAASSTVKKC